MKRAKIIFILLVILASGMLVRSTHHVFSQMWDESAHIVCGLEWLQEGRYTYEPLTPPLARIAVAVVPFLGGYRLPAVRSDLRPPNNMWFDGEKLLGNPETYSHILELARLGVIPFFVLSAVILLWWGFGLVGRDAALWATILYVSLPPILGWSGFAYVDIPFTAVFVLTVVSYCMWLDDSGLIKSGLLGASLAAASLTKMSAIVFLPPIFVILGLLYYLRNRGSKSKPTNWRFRLSSASIAVLVAILVVLAFYRFSVGPMTTYDQRPHGVIDAFLGSNGFLHNVAYTIVEAPIVPAPEWFRGVNQALSHGPSNTGFPGYLLGHRSPKGFIFYNPLVVILCTPIPFLFLSAYGIIPLTRKAALRNRGSWQCWVPIVAPVVVLVMTILARENSLRYVLPMYPFMALIAGVGLVDLWQRWKSFISRCAVLIILVSWQLLAILWIYPDYVAHYNWFAGTRPQNVMVGHDGGQDLKRLGAFLSKNKIQDAYVVVEGKTDLRALNFPSVQLLDRHRPVTGWVAIGDQKLKIDGSRIPPYDGYAWLEQYTPHSRVGKSINVYHIPKDR